MKSCPYCGEDIRDKAIKCKHCDEWLDKSELRKRKVEEAKDFMKPFQEKGKSIAKSSVTKRLGVACLIFISIYGIILTFAGMSLVGVSYQEEKKCDNTKYYDLNDHLLGTEGLYPEMHTSRFPIPKTLEEKEEYEVCIGKALESKIPYFVLIGIIIFPQLFLLFTLLSWISRGTRFEFKRHFKDYFSWKPLGRWEYLVSVLSHIIALGIFQPTLSSISTASVGNIIVYVVFVIAYLLLTIKRGKDLGNVSAGTSVIYNIFPFINLAITPVYLFGRSGSVAGERFYEGENKMLMIGGVILSIGVIILQIISN